MATYTLFSLFSKRQSCISCWLHTSTMNGAQANIMKKILKGNSKKKHKFHELPIFPSPTVLTKGANEGKKSFASKRVAVLNKLFMRHISEMMANGENAELYSGLGIQINRVEVTSDFKIVQVYWFSKSLQLKEIDALLTRNAGQLRHELTSLRVIGNVPKIQFLQDKQLMKLMELESQLQHADFGDDYRSTDDSERLKATLELNMSLEPHVKEKVLKADSDVASDEQTCVPLPPMAHDVFGLDHGDIMGRVVKSMKKSTMKQTTDSKDSSALVNSIDLTPVKFDDGMSQKEALKKFLLQRQLLKRRIRNSDKNYTPDMEYIYDELEEQREKQLSEMFSEFNIEEDDYIEEENSEKI